VTIAVALLSLLAACGSSGPATSQRGSPLATTVIATATLAPSPTTPRSTEPAPANFAWLREASHGPEELFEVLGDAELEQTAVIVGYRLGGDGDLEPGIWVSDNGLDWELADFEGHDTSRVRILDVTVGAGQFIAVGEESMTAVVWLSRDGRRWTRISDPAFAPGVMWHVGTTAAGVVAFGSAWDVAAQRSQPLLWTSPDGTTWTRSASETGLAVAAGIDVLLRNGTELWAFHRGMSFDGTSAPAEVWRTSELGDWEKVAELPGSEDIVVDAAAIGPLGWVVSGGGLAWTSVDGRDWERPTPAPPLLVALFADQAGYVAVTAEETMDGCSIPSNAIIGRTWVSADGRAWRQLSDEIFDEGEAIGALHLRDRTLVGVGVAWTGDPVRPKGAIWTARLPTTLDADGAAATPSPASSPQGCGD
jgi:hypothetical protein